MKKVYKLNLNKFGVFLATIAVFGLWVYISIEILKQFAGM